MTDTDWDRANAIRVIEKMATTLEQCRNYFEHQAQMNAQAHMSERVMYPPIHSAIDTSLYAAEPYRRPPDERGE